MVDDSRAPEVLVIGRCSVDVYPLQVGVKLEDVATFGKFLGGSATNVAVATARYGHRVTALTGVGDDPFGRFVVAELERFGVDASQVVVNDRFNTPVTFCEIFPPDHFPLYFYRQPTTPDLEIGPGDLPVDLDRYGIVWLTGTGLALEPSRSAHHAVVAAAVNSTKVLDLDYRERFWGDEALPRRAMADVLPHIDVAIGNREECRIATGEADPERAADALLAMGVSMAIVKQGPLGTLVKTAGERAFMPPIPVEVVNGLGAGDAFGGAVCHGLLQGWSPHRIIEFASAAGALATMHIECASIMPTAPDVDALLAAHPEATAGLEVWSRSTPAAPASPTIGSELP